MVTDTKDWFFLTIQAVGAATTAGGTGSRAGDLTDGSPIGGSAAAGLGTAGCGGDVAGVEFATSNGETFRMSNCSFVQTSELRGESPNAECLVQVRDFAHICSWFCLVVLQLRLPHVLAVTHGPCFRRVTGERCPGVRVPCSCLALAPQPNACIYRPACLPDRDTGCLCRRNRS